MLDPRAALASPRVFVDLSSLSKGMRALTQALQPQLRADPGAVALALKVVLRAAVFARFRPQCKGDDALVAGNV